MHKLSILLVDDHNVVRSGFRVMLEMLENYTCEIEEASNGQEAVLRAKTKHFDIIIMDIKMPVMDGIEATREIRQFNRDARILGLSMFDEENYIVEMVKAGAMGYMLKNAEAEELVEAIKTLVQGKKYYSRDVANRLVEHLQTDKRKAGKSGGSVEDDPNILSKRETEILKHIANEMTNEEIAQELSISKRTVDTHRQNILHKLRVKNTAGLIKYAIRHNLV